MTIAPMIPPARDSHIEQVDAPYRFAPMALSQCSAILKSKPGKRDQQHGDMRSHRIKDISQTADKTREPEIQLAAY